MLNISCLLASARQSKSKSATQKIKQLLYELALAKNLDDTYIFDYGSIPQIYKVTQQWNKEARIILFTNLKQNSPSASKKIGELNLDLLHGDDCVHDAYLFLSSLSEKESAQSIIRSIQSWGRVLPCGDCTGCTYCHQTPPDNPLESHLCRRFGEELTSTDLIQIMQAMRTNIYFFSSTFCHCMEKMNMDIDKQKQIIDCLLHAKHSKCRKQKFRTSDPDALFDHAFRNYFRSDGCPDLLRYLCEQGLMPSRKIMLDLLFEFHKPSRVSGVKRLIEICQIMSSHHLRIRNDFHAYRHILSNTSRLFSEADCAANGFDWRWRKNLVFKACSDHLFADISGNYSEIISDGSARCRGSCDSKSVGSARCRGSCDSKSVGSARCRGSCDSKSVGSARNQGSFLKYYGPDHDPVHVAFYRKYYWLLQEGKGQSKFFFDTMDSVLAQSVDHLTDQL